MGLLARLEAALGTSDPGSNGEVHRYQCVQCGSAFETTASRKRATCPDCGARSVPSPS